MTIVEASPAAATSALLLCADLGAELPQAVRLQRLVDLLRTQFGCGAVALLRLEEETVPANSCAGINRGRAGGS